MDGPMPRIQCSNESFLNAVENCNRRKINSTNKKSPTELFLIGKIDGFNAQEGKNSSLSFYKTDGQAKGFYNNLHLPIDRDNSPLISRSFDKIRNNSDNIYDLGITPETNDGTDSGIEVIRALSSNGSNSDRFTPIQSCGSSLVSYSSEPEADRGSECESESSEKSRVRKGSNCSSQSSSCCWKSKKTYERSRISRKTKGYDGEGTSESCSETSSTHEAVTPDQLSRSLDFKRSTSNRIHDSKKCENGKSSTLRRSASSSRKSSHDKSSLGSHSSARSSSSVRSPNTTSKVCANSKSFSVGRIGNSAAPGKCDVKGSKSKSEDSRWSSQRNQTNGARIRVSSAADSSRKISLNSMSCSMTSSLNGASNKLTEGKSNALDKYGTLPRRPKKKSAESLTLSVVQTALMRSHSVTREPSLNRAATLRRQQSKEKENSANSKSLPPYPRTRRGTGKIIIYHETGVQTVITSEDISSTSAGISMKDKPTESTPEKENKGVQTEAKERLKKIEDDYRKQCEETEKAKAENEELKLEKQKMLSRISKLLGHREMAKDVEPEENRLDELEKHFHAVGLTVIKQQEELSELRHYRLIANRDLEKSLAAQKNLLQQQQEIEEEYSELQEFLQAEKTALSESLLDTEEELTKLRNEVCKKQFLLEQQQEECKHLVRICEQRRQENLSLEAKLAGLDQRSRDVLVQQGAAVSAAAVALSGLGARLDSLVEQLSVSCNIKEKDLEDVIFYNEAYNKTEDNSPVESSHLQFGDETKRRESFIQVILNAIKNAAHSSFPAKKLSDQSDTFFDTEVDPSLNFENCLEDNTSLPNLAVSGRAGVNGEGKDVKHENNLSRSDSLKKLSDAILQRQMVEKNEVCVAVDEIIPIEVNCLVDQIVDVDNLVTKLLKVIRIIQGDAELHMNELREERENLTGQLNEEKKNVHKLECNLQNLKKELTDARCQLNTRITQLEEVKGLCGENQKVAVFEMRKRFAIIDNALGALNSVQDVVNQCPPLAKLQHELKDSEYEGTAISDFNANSAANKNGLHEDTKHKGAVLTTAI